MSLKKPRSPHWQPEGLTRDDVLDNVSDGTAALARIPVLPEATAVGALSAEAVRKGDFLEAMQEWLRSAAGVAGGLIFRRRGVQAALIAWMSGRAPRMAIIRFRL